MEAAVLQAWLVITAVVSFWTSGSGCRAGAGTQSALTSLWVLHRRCVSMLSAEVLAKSQCCVGSAMQLFLTGHSWRSITLLPAYDKNQNNVRISAPQRFKTAPPFSFPLQTNWNQLIATQVSWKNVLLFFSFSIHPSCTVNNRGTFVIALLNLSHECVTLHSPLVILFTFFGISFFSLLHFSFSNFSNVPLTWCLCYIGTICTSISSRNLYSPAIFNSRNIIQTTELSTVHTSLN